MTSGRERFPEKSPGIRESGTSDGIPGQPWSGNRDAKVVGSINRVRRSREPRNIGLGIQLYL